MLRARAADQAPVMLTPRQYWLIILIICIITNLLLLPSFTVFAPFGRRHSAGQVGMLVASIWLSVVLQMGLNFLLRYTDNPVRRWLDQRMLWVNILLRGVLSMGIAAIYSFLHARVEGFWGLTQEFRPLEKALAASQIFAIIVIFIQVAIETMERSQYLSLENERLMQEHLHARYEGLKQQLSPHFLFNSLSTLRGLIKEDADAAEDFVTGISSVYRYLLRHGEQVAVPLHEELAFLHSYCYLLQMRFGASLHLQLDLPAGIQERLLPPLALQLLVENAVKHNVLTRRQPLRLTIEFQPPATLRVCNSLRPRLTPEPSSGLGISNLANRVRMLHHRELLVEQTADEFCVYLPLPALAT